METVFLAIFVFGLLFTVASLALGVVGGGGHFGHIGHAPHAAGHHLHVGSHDANQNLPLLNASSVIGGLTWFGAAGYLLMRLGDWALPAVIIGGLAAGAVGWYVIARFLGLVLRGEVEMDPDDYRLEGRVGRVSVAIPSGGSGEILFEMAGSRHSEAARGLDKAAIPRGSEVVITAYADGFATVQPWGEFLAERDRLRIGPPAREREA